MKEEKSYVVHFYLPNFALGVLVGIILKIIFN